MYQKTNCINIRILKGNKLKKKILKKILRRSLFIDILLKGVWGENVQKNSQSVLKFEFRAKKNKSFRENFAFFSRKLSFAETIFVVIMSTEGLFRWYLRYFYLSLELFFCGKNSSYSKEINYQCQNDNNKVEILHFPWIWQLTPPPSGENKMNIIQLIYKIKLFVHINIYEWKKSVFYLSDIFVYIYTYIYIYQLKRNNLLITFYS